MSKDISKEKREIVFNKYGEKCAYCGKKIESNKFHVDHINPIFRGSTKEELLRYDRIKGTNHINNLNPSCISCNISKSTFTLEEWRNQLFLKTERLRKESTNFRLLEAFGIVRIRNKKIVFYFEKESEVNNG